MNIMKPYRILRTLSLAILCFSYSSEASVIDQQQEHADIYPDWGHGPGQTFTAGMNGILTALDIMILHSNNPGSAEFILWQTDSAGFAVGSAITTGRLDKADVIYPTPSWYRVYFDPPYIQSEGEHLAFTIYLLTFGSDGWNDYGLATNDYYEGGFRKHWSGSVLNAFTNHDWAFRTYVIPSTPVSFEVHDSSHFLLGIDQGQTDATYILQTTTNLLSPWVDILTNAGTGAAQEWTIPVSTNHPRANFYRTLIQHNP